jgi:hypothetical protein
MEKVLKIRGRTIAIVMAVLIVTAALIAAGAYQSREATNKRNLEEYAKVVSNQIKLQEKAGVNAVLPELYRNVKSREIMGKTEDVALKSAVEYFLEREALYHYATAQGHDMSDKEVNDFIESQLALAVTAENYDEITEYLAAEGVTLEDSMRADSNMIKINFTIEKLYSAEQDKFLEKYGVKSMAEDEDLYDEWDEYWDKVSEKAMKIFKKTSKYKVAKNLLEENADIIKSSADIAAAAE